LRFQFRLHQRSTRFPRQEQEARSNRFSPRVGTDGQAGDYLLAPMTTRGMTQRTMMRRYQLVLIGWGILLSIGPGCGSSPKDLSLEADEATQPLSACTEAAMRRETPADRLPIIGR